MSTKVTTHPKKKFGQNFLVDQNVKEKFFQKTSPLVEKFKDLDFILEIGPGQGDLTEYFLLFKKQIVALEIDTEIIEILNKKFGEEENLKVFNIDALDLFEGKLKSSPLHNNEGFENFILLANLPFNVGSRIMVDLPILKPATPFAVVLQKEVARKSTKLNEDFQFFGAWLNLFWKTKVLMNISPGSFYPRPKVYSSVLQGIPKEVLPEYLNTQEKRLIAKDVLKKLFANPKKTLFNNLKNLNWSNQKIETFFEKNNLDKNLRLNSENYEGVLVKVYCNLN
jgi:16S rRNA (adenine1518-N6/adenine1519-N6)-dimethyltransferase